VFRV
jgi:hypothetical protein